MADTNSAASNASNGRSAGRRTADGTQDGSQTGATTGSSATNAAGTTAKGQRKSSGRPSRVSTLFSKATATDTSADNGRTGSSSAGADPTASNSSGSARGDGQRMDDQPEDNPQIDVQQLIAEGATVVDLSADSLSVSIDNRSDQQQNVSDDGRTDGHSGGRLAGLLATGASLFTSSNKSLSAHSGADEQDVDGPVDRSVDGSDGSALSHDEAPEDVDEDDEWEAVPVVVDDSDAIRPSYSDSPGTPLRHRDNGADDDNERLTASPNGHSPSPLTTSGTSDLPSAESDASSDSGDESGQIRMELVRRLVAEKEAWRAFLARRDELNAPSSAAALPSTSTAADTAQSATAGDALLPALPTAFPDVEAGVVHLNVDASELYLRHPRDFPITSAQYACLGLSEMKYIYQRTGSTCLWDSMAREAGVIRRGSRSGQGRRWQLFRRRSRSSPSLPHADGQSTGSQSTKVDAVASSQGTGAGPSAQPASSAEQRPPLRPHQPLQLSDGRGAPVMSSPVVTRSPLPVQDETVSSIWYEKVEPSLRTAHWIVTSFLSGVWRPSVCIHTTVDLAAAHAISLSPQRSSPSLPSQQNSESNNTVTESSPPVESGSSTESPARSSQGRKGRWRRKASSPKQAQSIEQGDGSTAQAARVWEGRWEQPHGDGRQQRSNKGKNSTSPHMHVLHTRVVGPSGDVSTNNSAHERSAAAQAFRQYTGGPRGQVELVRLHGDGRKGQTTERRRVMCDEVEVRSHTLLNRLRSRATHLWMAQSLDKRVAPADVALYERRVRVKSRSSTKLPGWDAIACTRLLQKFRLRRRRRSSNSRGAASADVRVSERPQTQGRGLSEVSHADAAVVDPLGVIEGDKSADGSDDDDDAQPLGEWPSPPGSDRRRSAHGYPKSLRRRLQRSHSATQRSPGHTLGAGGDASHGGAESSAFGFGQLERSNTSSQLLDLTELSMFCEDDEAELVQSLSGLQSADAFEDAGADAGNTSHSIIHPADVSAMWSDDDEPIE